MYALKKSFTSRRKKKKCCLSLKPSLRLSNVLPAPAWEIIMDDIAKAVVVQQDKHTISSFSLASRTCFLASERAFAATCLMNKLRGGLKPSLLQEARNLLGHSLGEALNILFPCLADRIRWRQVLYQLHSLGRFRGMDFNGDVRYDNCRRRVLKQSEREDSNNVFVEAEITTGQQGYVEFLIVRARDECSIGVSHDIATTERLVGWSSCNFIS